MQLASSVLVVVFAAFFALWPLAFLAAVLRHALARRWKRVGQVAFLLPLWTVAASVGLIQFPSFLAALSALDQGQARSPFVAVVAIGLATCCGVLAWALVIRSLRDPDPADSAKAQPAA